MHRYTRTMNRANFARPTSCAPGRLRRSRSWIRRGRLAFSRRSVPRAAGTSLRKPRRRCSRDSAPGPSASIVRAALERRAAHSSRPRRQIEFSIGRLRSSSSSATSTPPQPDNAAKDDPSPDARCICSAAPGRLIALWPAHEELTVIVGSLYWLISLLSTINNVAARRPERALNVRGSLSRHVRHLHVAGKRADVRLVAGQPTPGTGCVRVDPSERRRRCSSPHTPRFVLRDPQQLHRRLNSMPVSRCTT